MKVTYEEQKQLGIIRESEPRFLPAKTHSSPELSTADQNLLSNAVKAAATITANRPADHLVRSDDNAMSHAKASLLYSIAYAFAAALITGAICFVGYLSEGGGGSFYLVVWLFFWGLSILGVLYFNRGQGLHHSSTGIAHHEIESREKVALFTISKHVELVKEKWKLENDH
jgi:hypothetical protein